MTSAQPAPWPAPSAAAPIDATVAVPGSKSLTNRFLILAAIAEERSVISNPLFSRDTELMIEALRALGAEFEIDDSGALHVSPLPQTGMQSAAASVHCGLAGTVMRFVPPVAAALGRTVHFDGDPEAYVRPMSTILGSLRDLGASVDTSGQDTLPFTVSTAGGIRGGHLEVDASASSQFVSGLLLSAPLFDLGLDLRHVGGSLPSRPHIDMTLETMADAGIVISQPDQDRWVVEPGRPRGLIVTVEPDLSNAAAFIAAALVTGGAVRVPDWPAHTTQAGDAIRSIAQAFGAAVSLDRRTLTVTGPQELSPVDLDLSQVGELTPVVAAVAACASGTSALRGIGHLRGHETDRLSALARELTACGADVVEGPDSLTIHRPVRTGALWHSYHDHRMVMAGAVVGLRAPGVEIENVATVGKTVPAFTRLWTAMLEG